MFYKHEVLAKKGPFGIIWLAGTVKGRLKQYLTNAKREVEKVSISEMSNQIREPPMGPLSLRTQSTLMCGLVIVYSRKVQYLEAEVQSFQIKMRSAVTNVQVNLPENREHARKEAITLRVDESLLLPEMQAELQGHDPLHPNAQPMLPLTPQQLTSPSSAATPELARLQANIEDITLPGQQGVGMLPDDGLGYLDPNLLPPVHELPPMMDDVVLPDVPGMGDPLPLHHDIDIELLAGNADADGLRVPRPPASSEASTPTPEPEHPKGRKRVLVSGKRGAVDNLTQLSSQQMKHQLDDPSDTLLPRKFAGESEESPEEMLEAPPGLLGALDAAWWGQELQRRLAALPHAGAEPIEQGDEALQPPARKRRRAGSPSLPSPSLPSPALERLLESQAVFDPLDGDALFMPLSPGDGLDVVGAAGVPGLPVTPERIADPESLRAVFEASPAESAAFMQMQQRAHTPRSIPSVQSDVSERYQRGSLRSGGRGPSGIGMPQAPPHVGSPHSSGTPVLPGAELEELEVGEVGVMRLTQYELSETIASQTQPRRESFTQAMDIKSYKMKELLKKRLAASRAQEEDGEDGEDGEEEGIAFSSFEQDWTKLLAARAFFQVLVLASNDFVSVRQDAPFGEILVRSGANM